MLLPPPLPPEREDFEATAYCVTGITKSGAKVAPGHVAADPKVIPLGSMIYVDSPLMGGIYQVLDTGELVKGKIIDIFIPKLRGLRGVWPKRRQGQGTALRISGARP